VFGTRYRKHLEDLFRGALALTRETHAKQAGGGRGGYAGPRERPIWVAPDLSVEPLPSVYARRADAYRFVRSVLEEAFGAEGLQRMHRLALEGRVAAGLADGLAQMERLFDGAATIASQEIGLHTPPAITDAVDEFQRWRAGVASDPDLVRDARMMVPVFYDIGREKTKVWAFLGWQTTPVDVQYRAEPVILGTERGASEKRDGDLPPVLFTGSHYGLPVPVMAEVYVSRVLDRDEFRRHCDCFRTRAAILAHLR
jgi:hypothetical protein